ncbi:shootin-1-like [Diachasma alloeum]|uniref:shootin-1-like n=1 Tax=Diachasma alloeum TaxID=454923 RepID=UPI0007383BAA|nr:shootin-1-like [Diachasma alloeum]
MSKLETLPTAFPYSPEPLESFLERWTAVVQFGLGTISGENEAEKQILEKHLQTEAIKRFNEYAPASVKESIRRNNLSKISEILPQLETDEFQHTVKVPALEIADNGHYSQPYNQSNTPTSSSSYGHRNYSEQRRNQDPSRDLVTALLNEYLPSNRNKQGNGYRQTPPRPPEPPPSIPGHTAHPGDPPLRSFNSAIAYGQTPNDEDESDYEKPTENADNSTTDQILAHANILAANQRPHAIPSKPKQNPSDMDEIKRMLQQTTASLQQLAMSLNNLQTQNRPSSDSRPFSRSLSREREGRKTLRSPTRTQQNRASPSTNGTIPKETLNDIVARQLSAMTSGQNQHSLHTMSSMHPRQ